MLTLNLDIMIYTTLPKSHKSAYIVRMTFSQDYKLLFINLLIIKINSLLSCGSWVRIPTESHPRQLYEYKEDSKDFSCVFILFPTLFPHYGLYA